MNKTNTHKRGYFRNRVFTIDNITGKIEEYEVANLELHAKASNTKFSMIFRDKIPKYELNILSLYLYLIQIEEGSYINITFENLAKHFDSTRQRISRMLRTMADMQLLKYRPNQIMLNPEILFKGSKHRRDDKITKYQRF